MRIDISHKDISSALCRRCAACCRISLTISNTTSRYRMFLRQLGYVVQPPAKEGEPDCCGEPHDVGLDMGYCRHLEMKNENGETRCRCSVYRTADFPQLCADFDCVSWAKHGDGYNDRNNTLVIAQKALNLLRQKRAQQTGATSS